MSGLIRVSSGEAAPIRSSPEGDSTRVEVRHDGWEVSGDAGWVRRRGYVGPGAWGFTLDHLADTVETTFHSDDDQALLDGLAAAYDRFFDEAAGGGFGDPPAGEWSAEEVVAHISLNDLAMMGICHGLIHPEVASNRRSERFENQACQAPEVLARWIEATGSMDALITRGRLVASQLQELVARLSTDQLDTPVPCLLHDQGEVAFDQTIPWRMVALSIQADRHLAGHTAQLSDLRPQTTKASPTKP